MMVTRFAWIAQRLLWACGRRVVVGGGGGGGGGGGDIRVGWMSVIG